MKRSLPLCLLGGCLWIGPEAHEARTEAASIDASLRDVYATLFLTASPTCTKAALNLMGLEAGPCRLPMVDADEAETAEVRAMLERHGLLQRAATA